MKSKNNEKSCGADRVISCILLAIFQAYFEK
jgi:hypothetical protein